VRDERGNVARGEGRSEDRSGDLPRLALVQPEIVGLDLQQLAMGAQAAKGEPRRRSRRHDELDVQGEMLEKEVERGVPELVVGQVVVVEDDHPLAGHVGKRLEQPRQDAFEEVVRIQVGGHRPWALDLRRALPNRPDQVCPEPNGIDVVAVEGQPGEGTLCGLSFPPLGEQRCLPISGRGADERQRLLPARIEELEQAWARHVAGRDTRRLHLRSEKELPSWLLMVRDSRCPGVRGA
jgi:hypothetical protein